MSKYLNYESELIWDAYKYFGAHLNDDGVTFRVYAPNAYKVSVAGEFNKWDYHQFFLNKINHSGIFEINIKGLKEWETYKFAVFTSDINFQEKADPFGFYHELRPNHASKVVNINNYQFNDEEWMNLKNDHYNKVMNIYELHVGSWDIQIDNYVELANKIVKYLKEMNYNYVELMPITEYPYDGSWGYQVTGFYSVTSRYGSLNQFKEFVDILHQNGIGVILDVVPTHFVKDDHGLRLFDGTNLYEELTESQWGTLYFDYGKVSNQNFFISSVAYFFDVLHIDGVRMDAVSNLIHPHGNKDLGINQNGINFLKKMNYCLKENFPNNILIAEDSSDFSKVTGSINDGGLGFDYKWDLGWMNDTLNYYELDPINKKHHHHDLTFSMAYFYSEKFILPLSHDEVVHGKKTIIDKMWGDYETKFALVKNLYIYMYTHPGKKLNFMGNELAHFREWDEKKSLDWFLLKYPRHDSFKRFIKDINGIYQHHESLSSLDYDYNGFKWIDVNNSDYSIYSYIRKCKDEELIVCLNMTGNSYKSYHLPVPKKGEYFELINSEKDIYNGCNMCNFNTIKTIDENLLGYDQYIDICVAPFSAIIFKKVRGD
ncbi:MAG: 1,4-alpha-glucan branching protein GlgB [Anaerorhabdus sp.]